MADSRGHHSGGGSASASPRTRGTGVSPGCPGTAWPHVLPPVLGVPAPLPPYPGLGDPRTGSPSTALPGSWHCADEGTDPPGGPLAAGTRRGSAPCAAGIGKHVALDLARRNARTILACRSRERGQAAVEEIRAATGNPAVLLRLLDTSSLASVRAFARDVLREEKRLDVLVNNAGVTGTRRDRGQASSPASPAWPPAPRHPPGFFQGCPSPSRWRGWSEPSPPTTWARSCSLTCCWVSMGAAGAGGLR